MQITYEIHYSRRRSISVSITPDCRVFVKAPIGTTESAIRDFLTTKKTWITKHLEKQQSESEKAKALGYLSAEEIKQIKKQAHKIIPEQADHMGLISELASHGVKLLLIDCQKDFVHFSDQIFARQKNLNYQPIDENDAVVISCTESRKFLESLGIEGEIIQTQSHSADGVALITDDGNCFVGDLEPRSYAEGYEDNNQLKKDWEKIMEYNPKKIYFAHVNEQNV